ncbi:hypothetical protein ACFWA4_05890 [Streptomyces sp. NPDC060011]|uniref:hypothetical protein n=1 Tax=Streptomyces sp. NPDC060011 TaxID=3347037 RepID=UPI0036B2EF0F
MTQPTRLTPQMPAHAYTTYSVLSPVATHFRRATCAEVGCEAYENGWRVRKETLTPEFLHLATTSGRKFTVLSVGPGETYLVYYAGQPCFGASDHKAPLDRPEFYVVRNGDWRGNPRSESRTHTRAEHWVEDLHEHTDQIIRAREAG